MAFFMADLRLSVTFPYGTYTIETYGTEQSGMYPVRLMQGLLNRPNWR